MKILVTGAAGRLGRKLIPEFLLRGHNVVALDAVAQPPSDNIHLHTRTVDLTDLHGLDSLLKEIHPELIVNAAAMTNVDACETQRELAYKLNAEVPARLAKVAEKLGARMIQVSTDYIFDGEAGPYAEDAQPNPIGYYGKSKLAGDNGVLSASPHNAIARTCVLFGYEPNAAPDFVSWLLIKLRAKEPVKIVTDQYSTPTLTNSLATGICQIAESTESGIFHLVGAEYLNRYEFALQIAEFAGLSPELITPVDGSSFPQAAPRPKYGGLTTKRTETSVGFRPLSIAEAMHVYLSQEAERN